MSREIPILFNGEMVRAILSGKKTQTRRPVKGIPEGEEPEAGAGIYYPLRIDRRGDEYPGEPTFGIYGGSQGIGWDVPAPVRPGDTLWVRETFCDQRRDGGPLLYRASFNPANGGWAQMEGSRWTPSIHMPRRACRVTLPIVSVRCERAEDISEADAIAESFPSADAYVAWWKSAYPGKEWCWVYEWKEARRA